MKKILVLNSGSSSLKYQLFAAEGSGFAVLAKGIAERIGLQGAAVSISSGEKKQRVVMPLPNHEIAVREVFKLLSEGPLSSPEELAAVGHRMGHGGEYFDKSVIINDDVMNKIYDTMDLLPLHGAAFVHGIEAVKHILPDIKQVAAFDSAFHQTMPKEAFLYALPLDLYRRHRIRRYGFHGTSHAYVTGLAAEILGFKGRFVSCHLGAGSSITAVKDGKSMDTSMGFTPMSGMIMGTRCGDIDPYIPLHLMKMMNKSAEEVNALLNRESGLFGLSGGLSDVRDIEKACLSGNEDALTAVECYVYQAVRLIGGFVAVLGGMDALIFTAGIGENCSFIRKKICDRLAYLGIRLDEKANTDIGQGTEISAASSKARILVIPTNEELMIAKDTYALISQRGILAQAC